MLVTNFRNGRATVEIDLHEAITLGNALHDAGLDTERERLMAATITTAIAALRCAEQIAPAEDGDEG